jgi:hypothetical protein
VTLGRICVGIAALVAGSASRDLHAQADPIRGVFRAVVTEIAVASELPRLDSIALLPGVRREIRIYEGLGLGSGNRVVRLVEHAHGVDGQLGVFWPSQSWGRVYASPVEERRARDEDRAWDDQMSAHVATAYNCHAIKQARTMRVCWLPERPNGRVALAQLLARLDSLRIDSIPSPMRPELGADGWGIIVEIRSPARYRAYFYYMPDSTSTDAGKRAAARVVETVWRAFKARGM